MASIVIQILFVLVLTCGIKINKQSYRNILSRNNTDTIRYACCIMVMFSHVMYPGTYFVLGYPHFVCVTTFFLLSGYGLTTSYLRDRLLFLRKHIVRITKIVYPLLTVLVIEKMLGVPMGQAGLYWFNVLILFYVFFGLFVAMIKNKYMLLVANSIFILTYSFFFQEVVSVRGNDYIWENYFGWPQQSIGFLLGVILALCKDSILYYLNKYRVTISIITSIILLVSGIVYMRPHDISKVTNEQFLVRNIISIACIVLTLIALMLVSIGNNISDFIGNRLSIYIFALHGLFKGVADKYIISNDLKVCFIIVCSILGAIAMYYVKKMVIRLFYIISGEFK